MWEEILNAKSKLSDSFEDRTRKKFLSQIKARKYYRKKYAAGWLIQK